MNEQWVEVRFHGKKRIYVKGVNINHYEFFTIKVESEAVWITLMVGPKTDSEAGRKFLRERRSKGIRKLIQTPKGVILQGIDLTPFTLPATRFTLPSFGTSSRRELPVYCPQDREGLWYN